MYRRSKSSFNQNGQINHNIPIL
uniref:Uncharacterized protein n=1 Tax=Anguilla anguilla TaxID=7936 RepID=A0A0E9Q7B6_ANGAN